MHQSRDDQLVMNYMKLYCFVGNLSCTTYSRKMFPKQKFLDSVFLGFQIIKSKLSESSKLAGDEQSITATFSRFFFVTYCVLLPRHSRTRWHPRNWWMAAEKRGVHELWPWKNLSKTTKQNVRADAVAMFVWIWSSLALKVYFSKASCGRVLEHNIRT